MRDSVSPGSELAAKDQLDLGRISPFLVLSWETEAMKSLAKFVKCESGATAIEYGLIAALIGVAIITVVNTVGGDIKATFTDVSTGLKKRPAV